MAHPIYIPQKTRERLSIALNEALRRVRFSNYGNEPNFTPAMIQQLHEFKYDDNNLRVRFEGVTVTSLAPGAAEGWSGVDFSVVTIISQPGEPDVRKATLVQAKRGRVEQLSKAEYRRMIEQIRDMMAIVKHPKVLEISTLQDGIPTIVSGAGILEGRNLQHQTFGGWVAKRVIPTFDGDTRSDFVDAVLDTQLTSLRIHARKKELRG